MIAAIFGSCVSRDLFEDPVLRPTLGHYAARSSVISAVSAPVALDAERVGLDSAWQRRSVIADFHKTFFTSLAALEPDWLVIDLIDERFDLLRLGGSLVTRSSALQSANLNGQLAGSELIKRMSHEGCTMFDDAARTFAARVTEVVPASRILLHRALWCPRYRDGDRVRSFEERRFTLCQSQNDMLNQGYDALAEALGAVGAVIAVDPGAHLADAAHRWELAPFHYEQAYNEHARRRLRELFALS